MSSWDLLGTAGDDHRHQTVHAEPSGARGDVQWQAGARQTYDRRTRENGLCIRRSGLAPIYTWTGVVPPGSYLEPPVAVKLVMRHLLNRYLFDRGTFLNILRQVHSLNNRLV